MVYVGVLADKVITTVLDHSLFKIVRINRLLTPFTLNPVFVLGFLCVLRCDDNPKTINIRPH